VFSFIGEKRTPREAGQPGKTTAEKED